MIKDCFNQDRLASVVDLSDNSVFIAPDVENRCSSAVRSGRHIRLPESGLGVLKILPVGLSSDSEPILERVRVIPAS